MMRAKTDASGGLFGSDVARAARNCSLRGKYVSAKSAGAIVVDCLLIDLDVMSLYALCAAVV